jgi:glycosyltransferase involved in cell wall biosynthesis
MRHPDERPTLDAAPQSTTSERRLVYISWAESCSRSDHTARELGGRSYMVYAPIFGSRLSTIALKYAVQWVRTWRILRRERPDTVIVMTPPVFAALPAWWYAWLYGKQLAFDAHTAAFSMPRWRHLQWLQRLLCRSAVTTIVSNEHLAAAVRGAGAHATVVPDIPIEFSRKERFPRPATFTVAAVCSFDEDEPIDAIFEAAAELPSVRFFMTGNPKNLGPERRKRMPANVTLTGFLSDEAYGGLLSDADAVLVLTTLDHTMQRGAYEAIYQGTPVIVSDWPILREAFPEGAVHVDNSPPSIVSAVRTIQDDKAGYRAGAERLRQLKRERWHTTRTTLLGLLEAR